MPGDVSRPTASVSLAVKHPDGMLCALVLAPNTFSRNRFYTMFEDAAGRRVRRRAKRLRGIIRQLAALGREPAEVTGRHELEDGRVLLRYRVKNLSFERTSALTALEAAIVQYALSKAGKVELSPAERRLVEVALADLSTELHLDAPLA